MLSATKIEALIRESASPADATRKILELLDADVCFERNGMDPQNWERLIAGRMTGMVFEGLQLKLRELEELAREDGLEEWVRHSREFDRDWCIETIEHVAGPGRLRLARDAVDLVQRDVQDSSQK
jgi:hypothetical protein